MLGGSGAIRDQAVSEGWKRSQSEKAAEQQLPRPREAVVVRGRLVGLMSEDRVHERRERQNAQQHDEHAAPVGAKRPKQDA